MVQQEASSSYQDCHRPVPPPFLTKTYQLVDDSSTDEVVSWGSELVTFIVWKPMEFARDLLPNYFKHNNFSSFVRQLNTYGFRKVAPTRWEFGNDYFKKGEFRLLCEIQRRKSFIPSTSNQASHAATLSPKPVVLTKDPVAAEEIDRLQSENMVLSGELKRMQRLYYDAVALLQQASQPMAHASQAWFHRPPVPAFNTASSCLAPDGSSLAPVGGSSAISPMCTMFGVTSSSGDVKNEQAASAAEVEADPKTYREQMLEAALADMRQRVASFSSRSSGFRPVVPVAIVSSQPPNQSSPASSSVIDGALALRVQDCSGSNDSESTDSEIPRPHTVGKKRPSPDLPLGEDADVNICGKRRELSPVQDHDHFH